MAAERHSGPVIRIESVKNGLTTLVDGEPLLVIDPKCKMLRAGFMGKYRHRKVAAGEERYVERPDKMRGATPTTPCSTGWPNCSVMRFTGLANPLSYNGMHSTNTTHFRNLARGVSKKSRSAKTSPLITSTGTVPDLQTHAISDYHW